MKKKIILSITVISTLFGCDNIIRSMILSSTNIKSENKYCSQPYCKDISKEDIDNPKIDKPIDLAVSSDGKNVYVTNRSIESCVKSLKVIPRGYIYKITEDKKISVLKINDNYGYGCNNRELIESDKNNNLYILKNEFNKNSKHSILKINNDFNIEKEFNLKKEEQHGYNYIVNQLNISKFDSTITYVQMPYDSIRVGYNQNTNKTINKVNENGSIDTLYISTSYISSFIFEDNKLNFGTSYYEGKYPYTSINYPKGYYESFKRIVPLEKNLAIRTMKMNSKKEIFALAYTKGVEEINKIYKIIQDQGFEVFAGSTEAGYKDGNAAEARFNNPSSIDFDANDNMYVADTGNNAIRKITPNGDVTTFYKQE
ncbi:MAG: hypothetical protein ACK4IX_07005 [Candidatus Sericytochromatia bacterium]